jgi:cytochrome c2
VPSWTSVGKRLRRDWVAEFLTRFTDLRPAMRQTMPRFDIDASQAEAIARWLVPDDAPAGDDERWLSWPSRGRRVLETRGCATCHQMSGAPPLQISPVPVKIDKEQLELGVMMAPDLRFTRDRFQREALVAWLMDPPAQKPDTPMPKLGLSRFEAEDVVAYLLETPLEPIESKPVPKRLPVLERRVTFKEVSDAVFHKVCWHCHSEPDLALGDGGPGNTGGFGFKGRQVNLRDYASVMAGGLDDNGERTSLFREVADGPFAGTPKLLAHMLARQVEEAGGAVEGIRGMPLGLPSMPPEAIQLVETWIAQGRPE